MVPGGGVPHVSETEHAEGLTSLSVSCAICPDGLTSKLFVSSDFFPPLQLTKHTAATSNSKETGENSFSFDEAMAYIDGQIQVGVVTYTPRDDLCTHV